MRAAGVVELLLTTQSAMWEAAKTMPLSRWLSASELARLSGMRSQARQQQFIACRYALRGLLAGQVTSPDEWMLDAPEGAAPTVRSRPRNAFEGRSGPLALSLSHSGPYIACAVADHAVGIDIEVAGRRVFRSSVKERAAIICSASELESLLLLDSECAQEARLLQLWSLKEAWFKQSGKGVDFAAIRGLECVPEPALSRRGTECGNAGVWQCSMGESTRLVLSVTSAYQIARPVLINQTDLVPAELVRHLLVKSDIR